ncbi:Bacteriophage T5, Orf172 DNA-binding [uncultured Caudovirales phage]|uniref:Bacteriophage T5, Orf172 DNA-binding n=1 Tax=uncultured Caudovirales phage TaxID=2100421 RepID=A0A6J7WD52_9CAUD|nr:Bacteriophage T5, Orf172 DNA-binding [uncultured Caudovirales phage]CAB5208493.1 Bacteriophage T5, Orf172 DNA-binding [uncultured Caudovirales phage]
MNGQKLFYIFKDPMGSLDSKVGITSNPVVRLGVYQNSYSKNSHTACLDIVYVGPARAVGNLEKAVKQKFDWDIERDGRGHSEWVSQPHTTIETTVDRLITGFKFKVQKVESKFLPLTVDNMQEFKDHYGL